MERNLSTPVQKWPSRRYIIHVTKNPQEEKCTAFSHILHPAARLRSTYVDDFYHKLNTTLQSLLSKLPEIRTSHTDTTNHVQELI